MKSWRLRFLEPSLCAAFLATLGHIFDLKLRADADVPVGIRFLEFIAGVFGVLLCIAGMAARPRPRYGRILLLTVALWCGYCAAFASVMPRLIR